MSVVEVCRRSSHLVEQITVVLRCRRRSHTEITSRGCFVVSILEQSKLHEDKVIMRALEVGISEGSFQEGFS